MGILAFLGDLMPNPFYTNNQALFQTIQFSHVYTVKLSKTFLFQANQFNQTVLIQTIQFRISMDFVYTQLNVKKVLFRAIV